MLGFRFQNEHHMVALAIYGYSIVNTFNQNVKIRPIGWILHFRRYVMSYKKRCV